MKRVLLTGMSGTGKSTLARALAARGYRAVDADSDEWSEWVAMDSEADPYQSVPDFDSAWRNRDWVWREDRVGQLLSSKDGGVLFVSGTASNQGKFRDRFDHIILLTAPRAVIVERLATRSTNSYGKSSDELRRVLEHLETVEPLLRRSATAEVDTSAPLDQVVETILQLSDLAV